MENKTIETVNSEYSSQLITATKDAVFINEDRVGNTDAPIRSIHPNYTLLKTIISRASYELSGVAQKLFLMSLAVDRMNRQEINLRDYFPKDILVDISEKSKGVRFKISDFQNALGVSHGGNSRKLIYDAVDQVRKFALCFSDEGDDILFNVYRGAKISSTNNYIELVFDDSFLTLIDNEKSFTYLNFKDISKLSSSYALRLYIFLESYHGLMGGRGSINDSSWYAQISVPQFRKMLSIENSYKSFADLKRRCISAPIDEINEKIESRHIDVQYIKSSRAVSYLRFVVTEKKNLWNFNNLQPVFLLLPQIYKTEEIKNLLSANKEHFLAITKEINAKKLEPLKPENIFVYEYAESFSTLFSEAVQSLQQEIKKVDNLVDEIELWDIK